MYNIYKNIFACFTHIPHLSQPPPTPSQPPSPRLPPCHFKSTKTNTKIYSNVPVPAYLPVISNQQKQTQQSTAPSQSPPTSLSFQINRNKHSNLQQCPSPRLPPCHFKSTETNTVIYSNVPAICMYIECLKLYNTLN